MVDDTVIEMTGYQNDTVENCILDELYKFLEILEKIQITKNHL